MCLAPSPVELAPAFAQRLRDHRTLAVQDALGVGPALDSAGRREVSVHGEVTLQQRKARRRRGKRTPGGGGGCPRRTQTQRERAPWHCGWRMAKKRKLRSSFLPHRTRQGHSGAAGLQPGVPGGSPRMTSGGGGGRGDHEGAGAGGQVRARAHVPPNLADCAVQTCVAPTACRRKGSSLTPNRWGSGDANEIRDLRVR